MTGARSVMPSGETPFSNLSRSELIDRLVSGNALEDGQGRRGWLVGRFIPPEMGLRHRADEDFQVKWAEHPRGDQGPKTTPDNLDDEGWLLREPARSVTISLLVRGAFQIQFRLANRVETRRLERPGDYALWAVDVPHRWEAIEDSVVVTFRLPQID